MEPQDRQRLSCAVDAAIAKSISEIPAYQHTLGNRANRWTQEVRLYQDLTERLESRGVSDMGLRPQETVASIALTDHVDGLLDGIISYLINTEPMLDKSVVLLALMHGLCRCWRRALSNLNTTRPINRVPHEIIRQIWSIALGKVRLDARQYYSNLASLRLTCKQWHNALDTDPSFWTLLSNELLPSTWPIVLEKSAQSPLHMVYRVPSQPEKETNRPSLTPKLEFMSTATSQVSRIQSFRYAPARSDDPQDDATALQAILESPAPLLEQLQIVLYNTYSLETATLFPQASPRLSLIDIGGWSESLLGSQAFKNLKALRLSKSHRQSHSYSPNNLQQVLLANPSLVHLSLIDLGDPEVASIPSQCAGTLRDLKTVELRHLSPNLSTMILPLIQGSSCEWIEVLTRKWVPLTAALQKQFARTISPLLPHKHSAPCLDVRCWRTSISIGGKYFELCGVTGWDPVPLHHVLTHVDSLETPIRLFVEEGMESEATCAYLQVLDRLFPSVVELSLPARNIPRGLLSQPQRSTSDSQLKWLFPGMTKLQLRDEAPRTRHLRRAIAVAAARQSDQLIDGQYIPGAPLHSIHIPRDSPYATPLYRKLKRTDVVEIKCDAPSGLVMEPKRRDYFRLAWRDGPQYPVDDGFRWVHEVVEPVVRLPEPEPYEVPTSDEEEPHGSDDEETDDEELAADD